jgi:membrane protein DedA with SNARE-associated domain/membrane-associated phospholipid phosphatase
MMSSIASYILGLSPWAALLVVFALPALESSAFVGFIFPGEIALILGGVLAYQGVVPLGAVLAAGIAGAVVGDSVGYAVGRRYGRRILDGTLGRFVHSRHLDRAEAYLAARGAKAVFFGRFTAALRVMIPGLAGMSGLRYRTFVTYNVASAIIWGTLSVLFGYLGGSSWQHVAHIASRIGLAALAAVVVAAVGGYLLRRTGPRRLVRLATRLASSPPVERTRARFPKTTAWVGARLDPSPSTGLALTTALAVAIAATWTFLGISQDVGAHEELALLDPRIHQWVLIHRTAGLDAFFKTVTWLGASAVTIPLLAVCGGLLARARRSWVPLFDIAAVYGTAVLAHAVVGQVVHRNRPPATDWLAPAHGWAYPSGHTTQAVAAWGILALLVSTTGARPRTRIVAGAATATVGVLVGISRIYLGTHWTTDVLGGAAMATAVLALWSVFRLTWTTPGPSPNLTRSPCRDVAAARAMHEPRRYQMKRHGPTMLAGSRRTVVVIPTYNEAGNVGHVLERVRAVAPDVDILVVDDNSPDGTAAIVTAESGYAEQAHSYREDLSGRVFLLSRTAKDGLGSAYRAGFAWALTRGYDVVVQMDADLSHPPERIPALLDALDQADVAVGSRYILGGGVDNWARSRRFISRAGNLYVRLVLGLPVHDTTAGFKAFRRDALERIGAVESSSNGYCFQVENTWRAVRLGLRVSEVPITFTDRTVGTSKMSGHIVAEALTRVLVWRLGELIRGTTRAAARHPAHVADHAAASRPHMRADEPKAASHEAA